MARRLAKAYPEKNFFFRQVKTRSNRKCEGAKSDTVETLRIVCCLRIGHSQVAASVLREVEKREVLLRSHAAKPQLKKIELSLPGARAMSVSALTAIIVLTVAGAQAQDKLDLKYEVFVPMG